MTEDYSSIGGYLWKKLKWMEASDLLEEEIGGEIKLDGHASDLLDQFKLDFPEVELGEVRVRKRWDRVDFTTKAKYIKDIAQKDYILGIKWDRKIRDYDY